MAHFSMPNSIPTSWLYIFTVIIIFLKVVKLQKSIDKYSIGNYVLAIY